MNPRLRAAIWIVSAMAMMAALPACKKSPQSPGGGGGNPVAATPEQEFADTLFQLYQLDKEKSALDARMQDYRNRHQEEHRHFMARFHELYDLETGWEDPKDVMAHHAEVSRRIVAARSGGPAGALKPEDVQAFANDAFAICVRPRVVARETPIGPTVSTIAYCERGDGTAPPVEDKIGACADFIAACVRNLTNPQLRTQELHLRMDELSQKAQTLEARAMGCSLGQWLTGVGDAPDYIRRVHEILRKHHPEIADETLVMLRQHQAGSVQRAQEEVRRRLGEIAEAEKAFRDGRLYKAAPGYWTADVSGLYRLMAEGLPIPIGLIDANLAAMDAAPLGQAPEFSAMPPKPDPEKTAVGCYGFRAVRLDADADPPPGGGRPWTSADRFAFCAYPLGYGRVGRQTYLIDQSGTTWFKDTDGKPVERMPADPVADGWTEAEKPKEAPAYPIQERMDAMKIRDPNAEDRRSAIYAIGQRPFSQAVVDLLFERMEDPDAETRSSAAGALGNLVQNQWAQARPVLARLKPFLSDPDEKVVSAASYVLGVAAAEHETEPEGVAAVDCLLEMLRGAKAFERAAALRALGRAYDGEFSGKTERKVPDRVIRGVAAALSDGDSEVAPAVVQALDQIGPPARPAAPALCQLLTAKPELGEQIVRALRSLKPDAEVVAPALEKLVRLTKAEGSSDSSGPFGQSSALDYLGELGAPAAQGLGRIVADHSAWSETAAMKLAVLGPAGRPAADALTAAMGGESDRGLRVEAAFALWRVSGEAAPSVEVLRGMLDPPADDRSIVVELLGRMGPAAAASLDQLEDLFKKEAPVARVAGADGAVSEKDLSERAKTIKLAIDRIRWPGIMNRKRS